MPPSLLTCFLAWINSGTPKSRVPKRGSTSRFSPFTSNIQLLISRYLVTAG